MKNSNVKIYDTTLRDGTQGEGISFSVTDKLLIAQKLDQFGVDYIEGGFPGSNPRDIAFFSVHMTADVQHSQTARELLETLCDTPEKCEEARQAAEQTVNALYRFLDAVN